MPRKLISTLEPQEQVDQTFRIADKQLRANRQGGKYILLRLSDRSGTLTGMLWNAEESHFQSCERGDIVRCRGRLQLFNGAMQMIVTSIAKVEVDPAEEADFQRFDPDRAEARQSRLREILGGIEDEWLRRLGLAFLNDPAFMERFAQAPAAITHHHAYPGGLLDHTVELMELSLIVAPRYPNIRLDLVLIGAFLHDLGKIEEMSGGDELSYTDRGQLVGHIVIGVQMLCEKTVVVAAEMGQTFPEQIRWQLEHLILSHHGQLEYGSPKLPQTLEAILLHQLDHLDAKIAAATAVIESDVSGEGHWTNYHPSLGRKLWKEDPLRHS